METKDFDLRQCVDVGNKNYTVATKLFEKNMPIYEVNIYVYDSSLQKWRNFYSEYYNKIETAVERHNYIINNINSFIERN